MGCLLSSIRISVSNRLRFVRFDYPLSVDNKMAWFRVQMPKVKDVATKAELDYNFQLERQILCTLKSSKAASRLSNPFFR